MHNFESKAKNSFSFADQIFGKMNLFQLTNLCNDLTNKLSLFLSHFIFLTVTIPLSFLLQCARKVSFYLQFSHFFQYFRRQVASQAKPSLLLHLKPINTLLHIILLMYNHKLQFFRPTYREKKRASQGKTRTKRINLR